MKERSGTLKNNKIDEPLIRFTKEKKNKIRHEKEVTISQKGL